MAKLTREQLSFLRRQGISPSSLFDASGMRTADWKAEMRELGLCFAFGVTPCKAASHTLRSRAGHCIQCKPENISYMQRQDAYAHVYVAGSEMGRLIKIGSTTDLDTRVRNLNHFAYGDQSDWLLLASICTPGAGRVEDNAKRTLSRFAVLGAYWHGSERRACTELFQCNYNDARNAVEKALDEGFELEPRYSERKLRTFNFRTSKK